MKDSKRIDNKAKSRRIAAYALAGCMAVTAAPITMPNMGAEVVEAATASREMASIEATGDTKTYDFRVDSKLRNSTTYAEIASKLGVIAYTDETAGTPGLGDEKWIKWASKAKEVAVYEADGTTLIWDSKGNTSVSGSTKLGYGKTYTIEVKFDRTAKYDTGVTAAQAPLKATLTDIAAKRTNPCDMGVDWDDTTKGNDGVEVKLTNVVFYPSDGMFKNEAETDNQYLYVDKNGNKNTNKTGVYKNESGWFLVVNGTTLTTPAKVAASPADKITETIEKNANGSWYIGTDGKVDFTKTGIVTAPDIDDHETYTGVPEGQYYVANGKVDYNKTGLVYYNGKYYKVVKGKVETGKTDVCKIADGKWVHIDANGESDNFTGIAKNTNGMWYIDNGRVDFSKEGPIAVNASMREESDTDYITDTYFVIGGKVQQDTTGVVFYEGEAFYLTKGLVTNANLEERVLVKDTKTGNWYAIGTSGEIDSDFSGLIENQYGTWCVKSGKVDFTRTGIVREDYSDSSSELYYVEGGKVQKNKNGVVLENGIAFNVTNGKLQGLDINKSVVKGPNKIWYILDKDGKQARTRCIAANSNGIWISDSNGIVDFDARGFHTVTEEESNINGLKEGDLVYFKDGKAQTDLTGFVKLERLQFGNAGNTANGETVYIKNGVYSEDVDVTEPTVIKGIDGKWYYADEAGIDLQKTGVATNKYGTWFVDGGMVKFNMTGFYSDAISGKTYYFVDSKLATGTTGAIKDSTYGGGVSIHNVEKGIVTGKKSGDNVVKANDGAWYFIDEDGNNATDVDIATNKNGSWYIKDGKVDFTKSGVITIAKSGTDDYAVGDKVYVVNGKVQTNYTGFVVDASSGTKHYFKNGKEADNAQAELMKGTDGKWYYVESGTVRTDYTGLAKNSNGIWYVVDGIVSFGKTGMIKTPDVENANLEAGMYYVSKGKMTGDKTGIFKDDNGDQYYVDKSAVVVGTKADESVIKVDGTWYCINDQGKVSTPKDGLAANKNGVWFIKDGKVDFKKTGLVQIKNTEVTSLQKIGDGKEIYISGGEFQDDVTAVYVDSTTKKYIKDGVVTTDDSKYSVITAVKGTDGKWYAVKPAANGGNNDVMTTDCLAKSEDGVVFAKNGVVSNTVSEIITIDQGDALNLAVIGMNSPGANVDIAIVSGKFISDKTGFINIKKGATYVKAYVERGICTKPTAGQIIEDRDTKTLYYVGSGYTVISQTAPILAQYGSNTSELYYVVEGKVRTNTIKNFFYTTDGVVYDIDKGVAKKKTIASDTALECSDGKTRIFNASSALVTGSGVHYVTIGTDQYVVDGNNGNIVMTASGNHIVTISGSTKVAVDADGKLIKAAADQAKKVTVGTDDYMVDENGKVIILGESKKYSIANEATADSYVFDENGKVIKSAKTYTSEVYAVTISGGSADASVSATASVTTDANGKITA